VLRGINSISEKAPLKKGGRGDQNETKDAKMKRQSVIFDSASLKKRGLVFNGRHLPYNPSVVEKAKPLRRRMTPAEKKLWYDLLRTFTPRFLRQRVIDNFIADFYCAKASLVVEVDGFSHYTQSTQKYDRSRTEILNLYGLTVIRFTNDEVMKSFDGVKKKITEMVKERIDPPC
jgi:very-short-patch-repair endonuclease